MVAPLSYDIVDVFTDQPYAGNPLAVVHGADGLSSAQMQAITAEFGLSETAFVLPASDVGTADYRVRIFNPVAELPFAGHPSIGTAWVLARRGVIPDGARIQECAAGLLPVHVSTEGARISGGQPEIGEPADAVALAKALGLGPDDIAPAKAGWAGAGLPYVVLLVQPDAVPRAVLDAAAVRTLVPGPYGLVICSVGPAATRLHARMFAPSAAGPNEDPATGSAAVALGVYLADRGLIPADGEHSFTVTQGVEIGRPSTLHATVTCTAGAAVTTTVGGGVRAVMRGELVAVPPC